MKYVLVTGGAGFIGSSLVEKLIKNPDFFVIVIDNLSTGSIDKLPRNDSDRLLFIKLDVNNYDDISSVFFNYPIDYVFHYAAIVGVQRTLRQPLKVLEDIQGIENICRLAKNTNVKRVFYSSSSEVYGESVDFPQNEDTTPLNARLPYAAVKNLGEIYLKTYNNEFGLHYTIFRFFNTYGPKQNSDFVISKFIRQAFKEKQITIYGDGMQTRTFCYIADNVDATYNHLLQCVENPNMLPQIINIGNDNEITILELAQTIKKLTNSNAEITFLPPLQEGDMKRRLPDITKMKKLLNRPLTPLHEGIKNILDNNIFY
ncbi:MAG: NAD-dependent epimerase/dehydratase family protein [Bacteroidales bacterium]|jgi:UDP-glucuronate decarboxylase|nr:NAD-dependent epimerase/dehydratase family protein [Bacteroidales bacterium]MDD3756267.1 NAD-dependent epimerase/dehydratase family protein [Bacteroidales bacterium]MDY0401041.1 NAD-dependent epimerase/dehydratase family protein [Bacteroidales bacterium]HOB78163.1 NAD-dependent epimerase/dehydratase family protein [Bacteroidales bacterium]HPZ61583.1 NAD-dependent epimerase/dehydratase family protein [Bacteroidales bacterium]